MHNELTSLLGSLDFS